MAGSPRNLQPIVHFVINLLFVIGEASAIARIWTRFAILKNFGWDDWAMVIIVVRIVPYLRWCRVVMEANGAYSGRQCRPACDSLSLHQRWRWAV